MRNLRKSVDAENSDDGPSIDSVESDLGPWYHGGISKSIAESRVGTAMLDYQELKAEREKLETERKAIHTELMQMRMSQGDATVLEVAQKEELLGEAEELVQECDKRLSEKLLGDTVEAFHLVYKPSGNPKDQVFTVCICRDREAQSFKHYNVFHWVQKGKVLWLSFSADKEDTKFDSFELLLDYFRRGDVESPAPLGAYVEKPLDDFFDIWHYIKLLAYCVLLFIGWVLCVYALASPDWVTNINIGETAVTGVSGTSGNLTVAASMPQDLSVDRVGIINRGSGGDTFSVGLGTTGHAAWGACIFLFVLVMLLQLIALVSGVLLFVVDKDKMLWTSRYGNVIGNLLMFLAMFIWPAGLDNQILPCAGLLDTKRYYVCRPWELGQGVVVQIVACIFLTIGQMVGSRLEPASNRIHEVEEHQKRERDRKAMWYLEDDEDDADGKKTVPDDEEDDAVSNAVERKSSVSSIVSKQSINGRRGSKRRSDGTLGPVQTNMQFRETSFWNDTFDTLEENPEEYLDISAAGGGSDEDDGEDGMLSEEAAMMLT